MQEAFLSSYFQDGDRFMRWIIQSTALADCVESWLVALTQVEDKQAVLNASNLSRDEKVALLLNGRNAAQDLQFIASDGGFEATANLFYTSYENCCLALLYIGEVA